MRGQLEKLAYEAALRGLDKQESLLEELRARTGVLLAASSLAASFLGQQAFKHPASPGIASIALASFVVSVLAAVFILAPDKGLYFSMRGRGLYDGLYGIRDDSIELHRRLAFDLDRFWAINDQRIKKLNRAYGIAAGALILEILAMVALLGGIFSLAMADGTDMKPTGSGPPPPPPPTLGIGRPETGDGTYPVMPEKLGVRLRRFARRLRGRS